MFTGIIESLSILKDIKPDGDNLILQLQSSLIPELKIDQSVSHNGICLTVSDLHPDFYEVVAIQETRLKTNISQWLAGQSINVERAMKLGDRLDGHLVQGHVDGVVEIIEKESSDTSLSFRLSLPNDSEGLIIEKGSVCLQGISLTSHSVDHDSFWVSLIPYTILHTDVQFWEVGNSLNIEYDFFGKMIKKNLELYRKL